MKGTKPFPEANTRPFGTLPASARSASFVTAKADIPINPAAFVASVNETAEVGTWVRLKRDPYGFGSVGIIVRQEPTYVIIQTDGTPASGLAATGRDFLILEDQWSPHDFFPMRKKLPYGAFLCAEGTQILFNRDHEPLLHRKPGEADQPWREDEAITYVREVRFYAPPGEPWRSEEAYMECVMILHGISGPSDTFSQLQPLSRSLIEDRAGGSAT